MKTWKTKSGYKILQILSGRSNVFLLTNGKLNILIDTSPKKRWAKLEKRLKDLCIDHIEYLILTHTHYDHSGNAYRIKEKFKSKVIVNKAEASYLTSGDNIIPNGTNFFTRLLVKLFSKKLYSRFKYDPCQYDILIDSYLDLTDFGINSYILHTPGHTIGSISVVADDEFAIVGDTMFGVFKWSVFPPFANDISQMIISWGLLLKTNCLIFLPAHGSANSRLLVQKEFDKRS